jgi:dienelactone hydrolase
VSGAAAPGRLAFPLLLVLALAPQSFAQLPEAKYRIFRPDGPGTRPEHRAEQLRAQGYVVIFVDYLGRRAMKSCGPTVSHDAAAQDLVGATAWLRAQPGVDPARITAMGWSYGGRAVLAALASQPPAALGFSRAVVYYPDCRALRPWKPALPILMLLGGDDDMTPPQLCQDAVKQVAAPTSVKVVVYPGALHGFDVSELPAKMRYGFATMGYHPEAAGRVDQGGRAIPSPLTVENLYVPSHQDAAQLQATGHRAGDPGVVAPVRPEAQWVHAAVQSQ